MRSFIATVLVFPFCVVLYSALPADDWPQWRGNERDGSVPETAIPVVWPPSLQQAWQITVGEGHSSPVLNGGMIFQFARQDDNEVAMAISPDNGKLMWQQSYAAPYTMSQAAIAHGKGPKSTPVVADKSLYTLGITGILSCFDSKSGKLNWQIDSAEMFSRNSPRYGTAMSPLVADGLCIAHIGGHNDGALVAVNSKTGKIKWQWAGDGPAYSSPVLSRFDGRRQIITFSQDKIIAVAFESGKLLWELPFKTPYTQNSVTPLVIGNDIVLSGLSQGIFRLQVTHENDTWTTRKVWNNSEIGAYMSTPVLHQSVIVLMSEKRKGLYVTLDPENGKILWQSKGREGDNAALLYSGDFLMSLNTDGIFQVAERKDNTYEFTRSYQVSDSPTWAHPVVFEQRLLVKNKTDLILYKLQ